MNSADFYSTLTGNAFCVMVERYRSSREFSICWFFLSKTTIG